jgi:hypothetical protein
VPNYFGSVNCGVSKTVYVNTRKFFVETYRNIVLNEKKKIGGIRKAVQCDETAFKKGKIILKPSNCCDNDSEIMWLLGIVEEETGKCYVEFVPNRKIETIKKFFYENVESGSIIKTDGYPSYPKAVRVFNFEHVVVNHQKGFRNEQGHTTNTIEGFWALLKYDIKKRKGISRNILSIYVFEFMFRRKYIKNSEPKTWYSSFVKFY